MPSNTTAATATAITLPYSITEDFEAFGNPLWFSYTAVTGDVVIGVRFDLSPTWSAGHYLPRSHVYTGPNASTLSDHVGGLIATVQNISIPVTPGETYWIRFDNAGASYTAGDSLVLSVIEGLDTNLSGEGFFVNDDTAGFPGVFFDMTGTTKRHIEFVAGERCGILRNGIRAFQDISAGGFVPGGGGFGDNVAIYNRNFTLRTNVSGLIATDDSREPSMTSDLNSKFYVAQYRTTRVLRSFDKDGNIGATTWTLPTSTLLTAIGVSRDNSTLYYARETLNSPVHRYDLNSSGALSDLIPAQGANFNWGKDILVLRNGNVVAVAYENAGATQKFYIKCYQPDGTHLWTRTFDANNGTDSEAVNRLQFTATDSATAFWAWIFYPINGSDTTWEYERKSRFIKIDASDGTTLRTVPPTGYLFNFEVGLGPPRADGDAAIRYGPSASCPFIPLDDCVCPPRPEFGGGRGYSGGPSSEGQNPFSALPPSTAGDCAFGGDVPNGTNGVDAESWAA